MGRERLERPRGMFAPVDPASLVAFRVAFGLLMFVLVLRYFLHGWIDAQFHGPANFFPWPAFSWIHPWPRPWMRVHFAALGALALLIAAGLLCRASTILFFLGFTYVHLIDRTNYLNHYYLVSLLSLLMIFLPLGRAGSLDAALGRVRPLPAFPAWALGLLRFQVGAVYFFAGAAKLQSDWLFRAQPLRLWLAGAADLPIVGPLLGETWVACFFSWASMLFDLTVPFLLLWPRSRSFAFVMVVVFHAATALLFPIGLFPWIMIVGALVFLPPGWPRRLLGRPVFRLPAIEPPRVAPGAAIRAVLALYVLLQIAIPLRHWALPGDVLWTEEGFRFAWKVMLVEKTGHARFHARDPHTGRTWEVPVADYLTPIQAHFMCTQADLVRDFARMVAEDFQRRGLGWVEVRADVWVSVNGRPARRLTDPSVDLARGS